jgi:LysR family transcriptional regulator, low CO2-responsive transcriptional regulator
VRWKVPSLNTDLVLKTGFEFGSTEAIKQGVCAGLGLSVLSRNTLILELAAGTLCILDVQGFPLPRSWNVVYLNEKKLSLVARTFLEFSINPNGTSFARCQ